MGSNIERRAFGMRRLPLLEGVLCSGVGSAAGGFAGSGKDERYNLASAEFLGTSFCSVWTFPANVYVRLIMIIESGPSFNVLGERESFLLCSPRVIRFVVGLKESLGAVSVAGSGSLDGGSGAALPDIIAFHTESTSIVAELVSRSGFFSIFLETPVLAQYHYTFIMPPYTQLARPSNSKCEHLL